MATDSSISPYLLVRKNGPRSRRERERLFSAPANGHCQNYYESLQAPKSPFSIPLGVILHGRKRSFFLGPHSTDWNWAVAIIVLSFLGCCGNTAVSGYSYKGQGKDEDEPGRRRIVVILGIGSALHLVPTVVPWYFVRARHWADVLRAAGHGNDAYHVDLYSRFGTVAIGFYASIACISLILVLATILAAYVVFWAAILRRSSTSRAAKEPCGTFGNYGHAAGANGQRQPYDV
jgi:hypothetical protein